MVRPSLQSEIRKQRPFESPEAEAYLNLLRTERMLHLGFDRLFKAHGLSSSSYNVLRILRGHEEIAREEGRRFAGVACTTIAAEMVVQVPDLTRLLDRLVRSGLAARARSATDRRVVRVHATEAGRERLRTLDPLVADLHRRQLGHLPAAELERLSATLVRMRRPHEP